MKRLLLVLMFCVFAAFGWGQNAFTDGLEWVSGTTVTSDQSPVFNGTDCQIQYTISTSSSLGFVYDPFAVNGSGVLFPGNGNSAGNTLFVTITFNTPVANFGMRLLDLDEDNMNDQGAAEEYLSNVTPPPSSVTNINGINPIFINGNTITPDDNNAANANNNPGGWVYWPGEITTLTFTYNRADIGYEFVLDSIHFECPCAAEPFDFFEDQLLCPGEIVVLIASTPNATYLWNTGANSSSITVNNAGTYWVSVTPPNGCPLTDTATVSYIDLPDPGLGNDTSFCEGGSVILSADPLLAPIVWQDGTIATTYTATQSGTYIATAEANGCPVKDTVIVAVIPYPVVDLGPDQTICAATSIELDAGNPGSTFLWSNNATTQTQSFSAAGLIWVSVANGACSTSDSLVLSVTPLPANPLPNDTIICPGDTLVVQLQSDGQTAFSWYNGSTEDQIRVWEAGEYWVTSTANGCSRTDTFHLDIYPTLAGNITVDTAIVICEDKSALIGASIDAPQITILWDDGHTTSHISISDAGYYSFVASTPCESQEYTIHVTEERCFCSVYVPNTFTPDGKYDNELFQAKYDCPLDRFEMVVFNRWGEIVFSTTDPDASWDGTYNGKAVPDGTYTYKLVYTSAETATYKELYGHVNVLR